MRAKDYLSQIHIADVRIGERITELNQMRERLSILQGIDYAKDHVQASPESGNRQVEEIVDCEADIKRMISEEIKMKHRIISEIQMLENPIYVDLLFRRYIEFRSFERIACDMGYVYNYVCNLHGKALEAFEDKVLK